MIMFFTLTCFLTLLHTFFYKWLFVFWKTQNERMFLHNRIFINSFCKVSFYKVRTKLLNKIRGPIHVNKLKFFRLHELFNPHWKQEYFNPGWNRKHHLQYVIIHVMIYKWKPLLNKSCEIPKIKRQKNIFIFLSVLH